MGVWLTMELQGSYMNEDCFVNVPLLSRGSINKGRHILEIKDVFRALSLVFFTVTSFFGTGNVASLNSFDVKSIQCLISVFSPFIMGGLLLVKVIIPFLTVALLVYVVTRAVRLRIRCLL